MTEQEDPMDFQAVVDSLRVQCNNLAMEVAMMSGRLAYRDKRIQQLLEKLEGEQEEEDKPLKVAKQ